MKNEKKAIPHPMPSRRDFERRATAHLVEAQKTLLPDHASEIIAINVDTGEYLLAADTDEAWKKFRKRWPGKLTYMCRVDGGPVFKFHGR